MGLGFTIVRRERDASADLMNSLDADGNGKGESNLEKLEKGETEGEEGEVYSSLCRLVAVKFTVAPGIEFNPRVSVNSSSRVTYASV